MADSKNDFTERLNSAIENSAVKEKELYALEDEEVDAKEIARIEEVYKALNKKLAATENNRWNYSRLGYEIKKRASKHLNSLKHGLFSCFPIPCRGKSCPYGESCFANKANVLPPYGEPCLLEVNKIENLIVSYAQDFDISSSSTTDRVLIQELIQLDILMDRCQCMMAKEIDPLQNVVVGTTEDGTPYTQPVVSRYYEAWDKMSRRRQSILNEMLATRRSKKGLPEKPADVAETLLKIINQDEDFMKVEERPKNLQENV